MNAPRPIESTSHADREQRAAALQQALSKRARSLVATLEYVSGEVLIEDPLCAVPRVAETGDRLSRDVTVVVERGRALVRLDDGSDVWLDAGARLELGGWREGVRKLRLGAGRLLALVAPDAERPFETLAGGACIRVTGTAFEAAIPRRDELLVDVLHGSIRLEAGGAEHAVRDGQRAVAARGSVSVERRPHRGIAAGWAGDISPSRSNPAITAAWRGAARRMAVPTPKKASQPTKEKSRMSAPVFKTVAGLAGLALLAGGAYWFASSSGEGEASSSAALPTDSASAQSSVPAGLTPDIVRDHSVSIRLKLDDGTEKEFNSFEELLAELGPEEAAKFKDLFSGMGDEMEFTRDGKNFKFTTDGKGGDMPGMVPHDAVMRDVQNAVPAMKALIDAGMSPEEAARVLEQSLGDSIRKQSGDGSDVRVMMAPLGTSDGDGAKVGVFITKEMGDGSVEATADEDEIVTSP